MRMYSNIDDLMKCGVSDSQVRIASEGLLAAIKKAVQDEKFMQGFYEWQKAREAERVEK